MLYYVRTVRTAKKDGKSTSEIYKLVEYTGEMLDNAFGYRWSDEMVKLGGTELMQTLRYNGIPYRLHLSVSPDRSVEVMRYIYSKYEFLRLKSVNYFLNEFSDSRCEVTSIYDQELL